MDIPIPKGWDDITAEWMTAALTASHPGVEVAGVDLLLVDDGTNRRARFGVTYAAGTGPARVFLKAADPAHAELNAATGGALNEPRLFQDGVLLPLPLAGVDGAEPGVLAAGVVLVHDRTEPIDGRPLHLRVA